ncbi:hypothetical protein CCHR01_01077 [Colletotrichum chrysophilum]|uniref:Uncharacterized protein n=1 Tax=Colletotrichum chrysophilum TaxID=1836956 RepID=A0AAD9B021_9PEZI|nr:hypothetical protein CCHR01_01077 [Colletotrichum chrysophilum]
MGREFSESSTANGCFRIGLFGRVQWLVCITWRALSYSPLPGQSFLSLLPLCPNASSPSTSFRSSRYPEQGLVCVCPATASLGNPFDQRESDTALPLITVGAGSRHIFPVEEAICKIWWSTLGFDKWSQHSPAERSPNVCPRSLTIPPSPAASHWLQRAVSSALQAGCPPGPVSPHSLSELQRRAGRAAQHLTSASQGPNHGSRSSFEPASRPLSPRRAASSRTVTGQLLSPWYEDTRRCRLPVPGSQSAITTPITKSGIDSCPPHDTQDNITHPGREATRHPRSRDGTNGDPSSHRSAILRQPLRSKPSPSHWPSSLPKSTNNTNTTNNTSPVAVALSPAARSARTKAGNTTRARAANRVVACSRPSANPIPSVRRPLAAFTASRPPLLWTLLSTSRLPSTLDEHPHHHTFTSWPCLQTPTPIDAPAARHASTLVGPFVLLSPTHHDSSSPHSILHALRLLCSCTLSKRPPLLPRDPITTRPGAPLPPPLSSSCLPTKHDALPDCRLPAAAPAALPPVSRRLPGE